MGDKLKIGIGIFCGIVVGLILAILADLKFKWLIAFALLLTFPIFVRYVKSWRYALTAVLIFSLSTQMSFNPSYSAYYTTVQFGWRISLTLLTLAGVYGVLFFRNLRRQDQVWYFWGVTLPLLAIICWGILTADIAQKPSYIPFLLMQSAEGFLVYFYAANFIRSKEDMVFVMRCVAVTVILTALVAIAQYFKPDFLNLRFMGWSDEPLKLYYGSRTISRPCGFLGHANNLAAFLAAWLPLMFVLLFAARQQILGRLLPLTAFGLGVVALILTFSRGGWLAFGSAIALIVLMFLRRYIRQRLPRILPRLMLLGFFGILVVTPFTPHIYQRIVGDDYRAGESRLILAKRAWEEIMDRPLQGLGFGYYLDFNPIPPHNIYLQTASELGIPGLFFFLMASLGFFRRGIRALRSTETTVLLLAMGLLAGLASGYLHGMVELGTIAYHKFLTYLFIGGLLVSLGQYQREQERKLKSQNGNSRNYR